jgi:6,7-dimethyl-8-ribityllumazine synthase|tara:strand:+ start:98 stop:490 length:393 start_codon:yes stop_codon:yes gene_type:complete
MKKKDKICIIRSKYNDTSKLLKSATKELTRRKISYVVIEVPGAFEIPVTIVRNINKYVGFIAIGSIIKGKTPNFDFISKTITDGLMQISILYKKPIGNAVLTCLNNTQAKFRANKGYEAAIAVSEVLNVK